MTPISRNGEDIETRESVVRTISREELKQKIDRKDNFLLVETLPATAYHHNHLPGAINLPPERVAELASQLLPDKTAEIVVYCASPT
jgi:rhodanese-related sulfurtransferase